MEKKARTFEEMPATFEYKGHTYYLGRDFDSAGWRSIETGNEMFRYYYGPNDDRMFLWVDCYLNPEEDLFDYDQFLPEGVAPTVAEMRELALGLRERVELEWSR